MRKGRCEPPLSSFSVFAVDITLQRRRWDQRAMDMRYPGEAACLNMSPDGLFTLAGTVCRLGHGVGFRARFADIPGNECGQHVKLFLRQAQFNGKRGVHGQSKRRFSPFVTVVAGMVTGWRGLGADESLLLLEQFALKRLAGILGRLFAKFGNKPVNFVGIKAG